MLSIITLAARGRLVAAASLAYRQKKRSRSQKNKLAYLLKEPSPVLTASATSRVITPVRTGISARQKFKHETLDPLFEHMRTQHLKEISLDEEVISEEQKFAEQHLKFSSL